MPYLPLTILQLADVAVSVLDEVGVERADVLGFSHGGAVAQQIAVSHPERVRALVLVSTSCGLGTTPGTLDPSDSADLGDGVQEWSNAVGALWHTMAITSWTSIPFLGTIGAPTMVVCGASDTVAPPSNSRSLAQRIPGASLVMLAAGHDLQRPEPAKELAHVVERFLESNDVEQPRAAGAVGTPSAEVVTTNRGKK